MAKEMTKEEKTVWDLIPEKEKEWWDGWNYHLTGVVSMEDLPFVRLTLVNEWKGYQSVDLIHEVIFDLVPR